MRWIALLLLLSCAGCASSRYSLSISTEVEDVTYQLEWSNYDQPKTSRAPDRAP